MATVEPVGPDRFEEIHRALLTRIDPARPVEEWRRIFELPWRSPDRPVGHAVFDGGRPVAYLGRIERERRVGGTLHRFCNVTSWIALEAYRREATLLALALRRLEDHTVTNLSPNRVARDVFVRLGFEMLETHWALIRPVGLLHPSAWLRGPPVHGDDDDLGSVLEGEDVAVFRHHRAFAHHAVAEHRGGYCHVVYTLARRRRQRCVRIHHLSSREGFARTLPRLQAHWLRRHGSTLAQCDRRLLEGVDLQGVSLEAMPFGRLYLPAGLEPRRIDNLYSEVVLLNLD